MAAVNNCYEKKELTRLLKTVITQLLRKGEKCRLEATNYWSIKYQMASKQKDYSRERNVGRVLITVLEMMNHSKQNLIL